MLGRTLSAMAGAVALAGVAAAADLAAHSPLSASAPPAITWTGFYVGLNGGGTWSNSNAVSMAMADVFGNPDLIAGPEYGVASAMLATTSTPVKIDGFLGGGQIGYNYQFANGWVAGLELDFQGIAPEHSTGNAFSQAVEPGFNAFPIDQFLSAEGSLKYFGTVRSRVGFLILPTLLAYGTGGLAYGAADMAIISSRPWQTIQLCPIPMPSSAALNTCSPVGQQAEVLNGCFPPTGVLRSNISLMTSAT
jgi:outer membrane immunogenic protein